MSQSPIRAVFFDKLQKQFYEMIKSNPMFKDFETITVYALAINIVNSKKAEINKFLDARTYTLKEMDSAIRLVIQDYLIPEVEKLRI